VLEAYLHGFFGGPALWQPLMDSADAQAPKRPRQRLMLKLPFHGGPVAPSFGQNCRQLWQHPGLHQHAQPVVHLVGYSLGARVALTMACQKPRAVGALTLIGVHPGLVDRTARRQRRQADAQWREGLEQLDLRAFAARWDAQPIFAHRAGLTDQQRRLLDKERLGHAPPSLQEALRVLGLGAMPALWPRLPHLALPVHLIVGGEDSKFVRLAAQACQVLPDGLLSVIPGAHHDVVLTHPHAVAGAMAAFERRLDLQARA